MGMRLQRHLGDVGELDPGQYTTNVGLLVGKVALRCPVCGGIDTLADKHVIDRGGRVTPAYQCQTATCSFYEWIELEAS